MLLGLILLWEFKACGQRALSPQDAPFNRHHFDPEDGPPADIRGLLASVMRSSVRYKGEQGPERWDACTVVTLSKMPHLDQLAEGRTCVQLFDERQGGYDGVIIDKKKRVV
eukprot:735630-Hanusia_phi.AAC.1